MPTYAEITDAISDRKQWEDRQAVWYQMRHDGIRRANKPWKNAADMHFPLADTIVEKLKPFYVAQVFGQETVATFVSLAPEMIPHQTAAAQWFDYQLRQNSNFEEELFIAIDKMAERGKCVVKTYWDAKADRLAFDAIDPLHLIVPTGTKKIEEADWIVHVQHFSKAGYRRRDDFDASVLDRILAAEDGDSEMERVKKLREGITHGATAEQVVVWEVFTRTADGWEIETYSPRAPTLPIRQKFMLPYREGVFKDGAPPFAALSSEIKDKAFYSSRGVAERVAPFEASLCRDWNTQKDYQQLTTAPLFYAEKAPGNLTNLRMDPGAILPFRLEAVQFPPAPTDLAQQMVNTRMVAEQAVAMPDFGTGQAINTKERKTATEIQQISNVMGQSVDLRGRFFRLGMVQLFRLAWALLVQYGRERLQFYYLDELGSLPHQALAGRYQIELAGTSDTINRGLVLQRAQARFAMFKGDPLIDQEELRRSVLEADDPRLVRRLFRPAGSQAAGQTEDQAQEITVLLIGFQAEVKPTDDHGVHLQCIAGFLTRMASEGHPLTAPQRAALARHGLDHCAAMAQSGQQPTPEIQQLAQQLTQLGQQAAAELGQGQPPQPQPLPQ